MAQPPTLRLGVYLLLFKGKRVLLLRRYNTGWADGFYTLPAGHVEKGEEIMAAMRREAFEEVGVKIKEKDMSLVHIMHVIKEYEAVIMYIKAEKWTGTPRNMEPNKCDDVRWFDTKKLPKKAISQLKPAFKCLKEGKFFSEFHSADLE